MWVNVHKFSRKERNIWFFFFGNLVACLISMSNQLLCFHQEKLCYLHIKLTVERNMWWKCFVSLVNILRPNNPGYVSGAEAAPVNHNFIRKIAFSSARFASAKADSKIDLIVPSLNSDGNKIAHTFVVQLVGPKSDQFWWRSCEKTII